MKDLKTDKKAYTKTGMLIIWVMVLVSQMCTYVKTISSDVF